jgi:tetratricopeptide (TPR) repeat protein
MREPTPGWQAGVARDVRRRRVAEAEGSKVFVIEQGGFAKSGRVEEAFRVERASASAARAWRREAQANALRPLRRRRAAGVGDAACARGGELRYRLPMGVRSWAAIVLVAAACSKKGSPERDEARVVFRGADGREVKAEELGDDAGELNWEVVGAGSVSPQARALHEQGRAAGGKGDYAKALELLGAAHEKAPGWPYPLYDIAYTYELQGEEAKAEEAYARVDALAPRGFFTAKTSLDCLRRQRGGALPPGFCKSFATLEWAKPAEKKKALEGVVEKFPNYAPAWKELAALLDDDGARTRAIEQGLAHEPDGETRGILLVNKALLLDQRGEHEAAVKLLEGVTLDPNATLSAEALAKATLRKLTRGR